MSYSLYFLLRQMHITINLTKIKISFGIINVKDPKNNI